MKTMKTSPFSAAQLLFASSEIRLSSPPEYRHNSGYYGYGEEGQEGGEEMVDCTTRFSFNCSPSDDVITVTSNNHNVGSPTFSEWSWYFDGRYISLATLRKQTLVDAVATHAYKAGNLTLLEASAKPLLVFAKAHDACCLPSTDEAEVLVTPDAHTAMLPPMLPWFNSKVSSTPVEPRAEEDSKSDRDIALKCSDGLLYVQSGEEWKHINLFKGQQRASTPQDLTPSQGLTKQPFMEVDAEAPTQLVLDVIFALECNVYSYHLAKYLAASPYTAYQVARVLGNYSASSLMYKLLTGDLEFQITHFADHAMAKLGFSADGGVRPIEVLLRCREIFQPRTRRDDGNPFVDLCTRHWLTEGLMKWVLDQLPYSFPAGLGASTPQGPSAQGPSAQGPSAQEDGRDDAKQLLFSALTVHNSSRLRLWALTGHIAGHLSDLPDVKAGEAGRADVVEALYAFQQYWAPSSATKQRKTKAAVRKHVARLMTMSTTTATDAEADYSISDELQAICSRIFVGHRASPTSQAGRWYRAARAVGLVNDV
jgi:hypothetical protein